MGCIMSLFATVAIVCTLSFCNDYVIDNASTPYDASVNTKAKDTEFLNIWGDEKLLKNWLDKYQVGETMFEIVSVDIESRYIADGDTP